MPFGLFDFNGVTLNSNFCFLRISGILLNAECTYGHFEQSSSCPTCGKHLTETDFREVNVIEASNTQVSDSVQSNYQTLFTKLTSLSESKALPLSDLCYSAIKQMDTAKHTVRFVLKQLLVESTNAKKRHLALQRSYENLKNNMTKLQQQHTAQRLQLEQANAELQQRLQAREQANADLNAKIKGQQRMIDQFRQYHNGRTATSAAVREEDRVGTGQLVHASSSTHRVQQQPSQPALKGFIMQKEAQKQQQQQSYVSSRQPNILGASRMNSSAAVPMSSRGLSLHPMSSRGLPLQPMQPQPILAGNAPLARPFSNSSSNGSIPNTPRIRDLSSSAGYIFTTSSSGCGGGGGGGGVGVGNQHLNKRRRADPSTSGVTNLHGNMSPTTAFTLNQGPYNVAGGAHSSRWANSRSGDGVGNGFMRR